MLRELGRTATVKAHGRSVLRPVRGPAGRRQVAFTGVRPSVRVFAEAPAAEQAAKAIKLEDVKEGSEYEGTVTTVEEFGAFVNFGANTNGLVHISKLASGFTKNAKDVVQPGQKVTVKVLSVDAEKKRVSLELKSAVAAEASAEESDDIITEPDREGADATDDDEDVEVELEDGQVEVRADLPGFEDIPFVMEEADMDAEMSEAAIAALEADLDGAEIRYELEAPAYMEEVTGKVARIEDYGVFLEFEWNGKTLTGLLAKDEMKVPSSALSAEAQAALRAEWADTGFEMPAFVELPDDELDVKKYYQPGESVPAFVLESSLVDGRGISLTHFTDEEVSAEAVAAYEELEDDEDEELDKMMADAAGLEDEVLAFDPEALMEEDEGEEAGAAADAGDDAEYEGVSADGLEGANGNYALGATRSGLIKGKNGYQVAPMGLPSRPLNDAVTSSGLAILGTSEVDFDGDEVQLVDYWTSEAFDNIPKDVLKKLGLKMSYTEAGEAEFEERADFEATDVPFYLYGGDVESRAKEFVADLLSDDVDEAELPARAGRAPIVLAAAVQNISAAEVKALREKTGAGMMDCKKALAECAGDAEAAAEWLRKKGLSGADKKAGRIAAEGAVARYIHPGSRLGVLLEVNCETDFVAASEKFQALVNELGMIIAATDCICVSPEDVPEEVLAKEREVEMGKEDLANKPEAIRAKIVEGRLQKMRDQVALTNQATLSNPDKTVAELVKETIAAVGENVKIRRFIKYRLGEGLEKKANDFAAEVAQQTQAKAAAPAAPKKEEPKKEEPKKATVAVSAGTVKELRDKTGAGMMDCKKALAENENDMEKATEWLRMKGLAGADKKAGRIAAEGVVASYIHPGSRLGVLLEVNCETDFVAASEKFNELVNYIAMGIVAGQNVQYVSADEIPAEVFEREKQLEMARDDLKGKPDAIRAKIAEGRAKKIATEMCLLDQPFLTDPSKTVAEAIKESIAAIGEKISVRRFVKFQLGEGLEKKSNDFAAEVAAATGAK
ncbi:hypothetical protein CHLRE_12g519180v5 [Chlamydomonas reinhardtii]|uniref:Polyprotein of EF-Ts, chloroplastic n=1 Tax=Chlamydomonas reinhardtii TaxID=3055 RepID=PETS_CHLRE|nr:uncharacterized protein CHLRE_12g519180v5 [Chlamydomonas reinhardtii]A8J637.1 RecName: Full=Polyprotein of EF-Ts, chloroplastic; Short=110 kDa pro-protein; Contains: RecName: Full=Plastid-specific ribosomal protein-7, chloroplastic; Short=65 kDa protein PSRP-7; Short=CrePSRP-7; Contains: RecName: Full=Elongation factor Ts, chloroplastic; Short=55 kDa protein EF-Ts; Short=EF-Ts; Flags: Precursor [Chlamydomonas reinhardtii]PNW75255.1 hypothetical protein CHLRE_12g519180v5 [Chlamydomonas reinhard|eukprot:XP_001696943.1 polyprotein of PSRP-7 and EF-Ts, imported to chloroplast [Chlamydomonas reinhardtii]